MSKFMNLYLLFTLFLFTGLSLNSYAGPVCGNNTVENPPEECDEGNIQATDTCTNLTVDHGFSGNTECTKTFCGDFVTQPTNGFGFTEACDEGPVTTATCTDMCDVVTTTTTTTAAATTTTTAAATTTTAAATTTTAAATTTTAAATTTTAAATTTTAAATTTTAAATTTTAAATTTTAAATTTTAAATTTTAAATTTTMGGGPTTTATPTTTTTTASTSTTGATTTTTLPPSSGESVTVPVEGGDTVTITTESGETVTDVSTSEVTDVPRGMEFPFGAISYTTTSPKGGTVTMRFKFSSDLPKDLTIFKIDEDGNKTRLPKKLWEKVNARTLDVKVTDGDSLTDQDGKKNGSIKDPLAVASDPDTFDFGGGGCTISNTQATSVDPIWLFLLVVPGLGLLRRRRVAADSTRRTSS